jgi:hypothetical protein
VHTDPTPHGPVEAVLDELFTVRGSFAMGPLVRIPRTMCVLRSGRSLTLINAVRLTPEGEAALEALGEVRHLVRLGHLHGCDDAWYLQRYGCSYWALPGEALPGAVPDRTLREGGELPIPGARLIALGRARMPEAALWLPQDGGTLITCDALQNAVDMAHASPLGALISRLMGSSRPCAVVPAWRLRQGGDRLAPDLARLTSLPFENLVTGHGPAQVGGADALATRAVSALWPRGLEAPQVRNRRALERACLAWNQGQLDAYVASLYAPEAELVDASGRWQGRAAIAARYAPLFAGPPPALSLEGVVAEGDLLAARFRLDGASSGLTWMRFEGGQVVERWTPPTTQSVAVS